MTRSLETHPAQGFVPGGETSTSMPTAYSPGLQWLSELPGATLVHGPRVVPGGLGVVWRSCCASTTELDANMTTARTASFMDGFARPLLPLAVSLLPTANSRPIL